MHSKRLVLTATMAAVALAACGGGGSDGGSNSDAAVLAAQPKMSETPMDTIVQQQLLPTLDRLFTQVRTQGLDTEMQGVKVFAANSGDKFLPGKVAIGFSYLLLNTAPTDAKHQAYLQGYRDIADMTINVTNETWGIYYYMSALWKLKKAGLLDGSEAAIRAETLEALKPKLDWRLFVDPADYSLKNNLPTNYYGVAFSVARLRYLMGWEGPEDSEALLQKMINHYKTFSAFGFSDETDGSGRFDRYSILLIGEIMQRLIETGMQVSAADEAALRGWLRQSVDVIKLRMNPAGNGVDYGRSLSAYADTAFAEVLSAAEHMNVLSVDEKAQAYAFATRVTAKYAEFWYDPEMGSLNMWLKGRRTDGYRGMGRILGENLSLSHQLIYTNNLWKQAGFAQAAPMVTKDFVQTLQNIPASSLTKFAGFDGKAGTYDRGLVTYRDGLRIISLPVVNGAATYHRTNPYFAIPHSYNMISGVADTQWPQLQPRFSVKAADGVDQVLIPAAYQQNLQYQPSDGGKKLSVRFSLDAMDRIAGEGSGAQPKKDDRITATSQYQFEPGRITRTDTYTPKAPLDLSKIELEFGSYSQAPRADGKTQFVFGSGDVTGFAVQGLDACEAVDVSNDANYNTPGGALRTSIRCSSAAKTLSTPITIVWTLNYRSGSLAGMGPQ